MPPVISLSARSSKEKAILQALAYQNDRIAGASARLERLILCVLLILFYVSYGALGRDIFYNHLNVERGAVAEDPIGSYLPIIRIAVCCVTFVFVAFQTDIRWALSKIPWILLPFCVVALASTLWGDDSKAVLRNAAQTILMWACICPLIHRLGLASTVRVTLFCISVVCIASFLLAIFVPLIGRHSGLEASQTSHIGEWRGIFGHKNGLGPWAAWGTVFIATHHRLCPGPRLYWIFAFVCALSCLIFAHSATAVTIAIFCIVLHLLFIVLRRQGLAAASAIFGLGFSFFLIFYLFAGDEIFSALGRDSTFTGRTEIWAISYNYAFQRPFLGYGFQRMGGTYLSDRLFITFGQPLGPENGYLALLLDLGIVGLVTFFIPYMLAIRNGFEWLKHTTMADRSALELEISVLLSTLLASFTTADILLSTGYDGVFSFIALFALCTTPKSPEGVFRGEYRLAKYRLPGTTDSTASTPSP